MASFVCLHVRACLLQHSVRWYWFWTLFSFSQSLLMFLLLSLFVSFFFTKAVYIVHRNEIRKVFISIFAMPIHSYSFGSIQLTYNNVRNFRIVYVNGCYKVIFFLNVSCFMILFGKSVRSHWYFVCFYFVPLTIRYIYILVFFEKLIFGRLKIQKIAYHQKQSILRAS